MVEGNDIWISVLVLVVRLLTLLGSELIQARSSSKEKYSVRFMFVQNFFSWVGWMGGSVPLCVGRGQ